MFDSYGDGGGSVLTINGGVTATNAGVSSATCACVDLSACTVMLLIMSNRFMVLAEGVGQCTDTLGAVLAEGLDADGFLETLL